MADINGIPHPDTSVEALQALPQTPYEKAQARQQYFERLPKAKKRNLAVGSRLRLDVFLAFYVLHLSHGDDLEIVYLDEYPEDNLPQEVLEVLMATGYERIYAFNGQPGKFYETLRQTQAYMHLTNEAAWEETAEGDHIQVLQRFDDCVMAIDNHITHLISVTRVHPQRRYPMTSLVLQVLYFTLTQTWFKGATIAALPMNLHPSITSAQNAKLLDVWAMLESLPGYAHKDAVQLHETLETLPRTFEAFDEYFNGGTLKP